MRLNPLLQMFCGVRVETLPPRHSNTTNELGAPCGVTERGIANKIQSGELEVEWNELVPQNGYFEIYFSEANDSNWKLLKKIDNVVEDPDATFINHKTKVAIPDINCSECTLQIIQVVTGAVEARFYSCSDISVTPASSTNTSSTSTDNCPE